VAGFFMHAPATTSSVALQFNLTGHSPESLRDTYRQLLLPRTIEEKMLIYLRQGKISKWFSGIGQEAIAVGVTMALRPSDFILPLHRNLGVFTVRGLPLHRLFSQWEGRAGGYTKGRDRSFHFGSPPDHIAGMISHLGAMLGVADGLALAQVLDGTDDIAVVFSGDGGASEGDFHEAVNVASVWDLPVIFVVENNGYGLSTPSSEQFRHRSFVDKAPGYGIEGYRVDGNNILEVVSTMRTAADTVRRTRRPVIFEAMTFRMRGHEEASGTKYVPQHLFDEWKRKDPVETFERALLDEGVITPDWAAEKKRTFMELIEAEWERSAVSGEVVPFTSAELNDVYAPAFDELTPPDTSRTTRKRFVNAVQEGLRQAMEQDKKLVLMGQDIAGYGGVFKVTEGFVDQFGSERVRNTPLCESAILGAALGLSIAGRASMVEMQFADFVTCGFNQIVNNLAKSHYRWGHAANVVVRMPTGAGVGAGPFHSQSTESWFTHVPGLKVVYPSTPFDAKGLLTTSLRDPNPVLFFEHKFLYRSAEGDVPDGYYNLPLGVATVVREGTDATIITYGWAVHWALEAAEKSGRSIEVIDLRTLLPWDRETVFTSARKTGRVLLLTEDTQTGAFIHDIAAAVGEVCFSSLDAPVMRLGSLDTPVPFNRALEENFLARTRLTETLERLLSY
jgi:2-oxoisovalerate dehydrogenase E1 component